MNTHINSYMNKRDILIFMPLITFSYMSILIQILSFLPCLPKDSINLEKNNKISGTEKFESNTDSNINTAEIGFNQQIRAMISPNPENCSGKINSNQ